MTTLFDIANKAPPAVAHLDIASGCLEPVFSPSREFVLLPKPKGSGDFWCPASLLRAGTSDGKGNKNVCIPLSFVVRNAL